MLAKSQKISLSMQYQLLTVLPLIHKKKELYAITDLTFNTTPMYIVSIATGTYKIVNITTRCAFDFVDTIFMGADGYLYSYCYNVEGYFNFIKIDTTNGYSTIVARSTQIDSCRKWNCNMKVGSSGNYFVFVDSNYIYFYDMHELRAWEVNSQYNGSVMAVGVTPKGTAMLMLDVKRDGSTFGMGHLDLATNNYKAPSYKFPSPLRLFFPVDISTYSNKYDIFINIFIGRAFENVYWRFYTFNSAGFLSPLDHYFHGLPTNIGYSAAAFLDN